MGLTLSLEHGKPSAGHESLTSPIATTLKKKIEVKNNSPHDSLQRKLSTFPEQLFLLWLTMCSAVVFVEITTELWWEKYFDF